MGAEAKATAEGFYRHKTRNSMHCLPSALQWLPRSHRQEGPGWKVSTTTEHQQSPSQPPLLPPRRSAQAADAIQSTLHALLEPSSLLYRSGYQIELKQVKGLVTLREGTSGQRRRNSIPFSVISFLQKFLASRNRESVELFGGIFEGGHLFQRAKELVRQRSNSKLQDNVR